MGRHSGNQAKQLANLGLDRFHKCVQWPNESHELGEHWFDVEPTEPHYEAIAGLRIDE